MIYHVQDLAPSHYASFFECITEPSPTAALSPLTRSQKAEKRSQRLEHEVGYDQPRADICKVEIQEALLRCRSNVSQVEFIPPRHGTCIRVLWP